MGLQAKLLALQTKLDDVALQIDDIHKALEAGKYKVAIPAVVGTGTVAEPEIPAIPSLAAAITTNSNAKINDIHSALEASKYKKEVPAIPATLNLLGAIVTPAKPIVRTLGYSIINSKKQSDEVHEALNIAKYINATPAIIGTGTPNNPQIPEKHNLDYFITSNPLVVSTWESLGRGEFSTHKTKPGKERTTNIGWYIEAIARVLGIRFDNDGKIDFQEEERYYKRAVYDNPIYDPQSYSKNSFGKFGRLTPHLTNSEGENTWDKVADLPQLLEAQFEHINRSLGIQMGTEIIVKNAVSDKDDYYPNQLAMLLDIHAKITEMQLNSKQSFNLLYVLSHEIRELWSGIGIPMVYRELFNRYGAIMSIGHQTDKGSLLTHLTTLKINLGILLGNTIARPRDKRNPLENIFARKDKDT
jgi:hypothetical protein